MLYSPPPTKTTVREDDGVTIARATNRLGECMTDPEIKTPSFTEKLQPFDVSLQQRFRFHAAQVQLPLFPSFLGASASPPGAGAQRGASLTTPSASKPPTEHREFATLPNEVLPLDAKLVECSTDR